MQRPRCRPHPPTSPPDRFSTAMPTALITGASGGIGSAIADALAPTHTLLLAGRPSPRLDAVAERLGATTWPLDLTDVAEIEAATEVIDELDVLVHNAGVMLPGPAGESDEAGLRIERRGSAVLTDLDDRRPAPLDQLTEQRPARRRRHTGRCCGRRRSSAST